MDEHEKDQADKKATELLPCYDTEYCHTYNAQFESFCVSCRRRPAVAAEFRKRDAELARLRAEVARLRLPHDAFGSYWVCEIHPELDWSHDDCAGPGMPVTERARVIKELRAELANLRRDYAESIEARTK